MRDPDKNRFLRAVRHIESEEVPLAEIDPDLKLVNRILNKAFPLSLHAYELPVDDDIELNRRLGNDLVYFAEIWRLGRREHVDDEGRIHYVDGTMKTPDSLEDIWFPDLDDTERRLAAKLEALEGTGLGIMCHNHSAPGEVATAIGYEDYFIAAIEQPDFVMEFQKRLHDFCMKELELYARYPVDVISIAAFWTVKSGPVCSPAMREELMYPLFREQADQVKANGHILRLHVDGNPTALLPDIIDMGVDVLHPLEPCDGNVDIYAIKEQYGDRIALWGNMDVAGVLGRGSPEDVRADTIEHMERLAVGGGYVAASSHDLSENIPLENVYAMRDAVHTFRFGE